MASSDSHRQMVMSEIEATRPRAMASARMSGTCRRDRGRPSVNGRSQASALISTTTPGGKDRGPPVPGPFVEPRQALLVEALAPLGDDLSRQINPRRDRLVG